MCKVSPNGSLEGIGKGGHLTVIIRVHDAHTINLHAWINGVYMTNGFMILANLSLMLQVALWWGYNGSIG